MNLFVDDCREWYDGTKGWIVVRTYDEAIQALQTHEFKHVSLDHDLGLGKSGYDVICWIEKENFEVGFTIPPSIVCHSSNPVGRKRIEQVITKLVELGKETLDEVD